MIKKFGDPAVRIPKSLAEREFFVDKPIVSAWEKAFAPESSLSCCAGVYSTSEQALAIGEFAVNRQLITGNFVLC